MDNSCMVSVICMSYNHEKYIAKCLDSIVRQKTDFKYEIIIHDDASTDNSAKIIREYAEKYPDLFVTVIQKENQFSQRINIFNEYLLPKASGKYIATCECDDFWTDDTKLQKQVDFLENNPEFVLCTHAAYYANEDGTLKDDLYFGHFDSNQEIPLETILTDWCFATNSKVFLKDIFPLNGIPFKGKCINGDFAMAVYLALQGKVYYINELMSAYRVNSVSSLTRIFINDTDRFKRERLEFFNMLGRIDQYTNGQYHDIITSYKEKCEFELYLSIGDLNKLKEYPLYYGKLTSKEKTNLIIKDKAPFLVPIIRKIRGQK